MTSWATVELLKTIFRFGVFAGFVGLGLNAQTPDGHPRRRVVLALVLYTLVTTAAVGFSQKEAWPFTTWALVSAMRESSLDRWDLIGFDAQGRPWVLDFRVLEPFAPEDFHSWMRLRFMTLDPRARQVVADDIIRRAETGRQRFLRTGRIGTNGTILRSLTAPRHFHRASIWKRPTDVPTTPFVRLQVRFVSWDIERTAVDPQAIKSEVLFESR